MRAYLDLLRYGPAARPFLAALIARLPMSMAPLGIRSLSSTNVARTPWPVW